MVPSSRALCVNGHACNKKESNSSRVIVVVYSRRSSSSSSGNGWWRGFLLFCFFGEWPLGKGVALSVRRSLFYLDGDQGKHPTPRDRGPAVTRPK